jgi:hypothetical protein
MGDMPRKIIKSRPALRRWQIILIRNRGERLGIVSAQDAEAAIRLAIKQFEITDPHRRSRLAAQPIGWAARDLARRLRSRLPHRRVRRAFAIREMNGAGLNFFLRPEPPQSGQGVGGSIL